MVLLPLCYVALIGLVGWLTWFHLRANFSAMAEQHNVTSLLFLYIGPAFVGVIVICFMLKPLFSKRLPAPPTYSLNREKEPLLFAFIERVCQLVRAPMPKRVDVNCEVNATAGFRRGFLSLAGNDLVLTIGLPLASGLNMREFAGVLAHEFGHFTQGAGMRLSYVIRRINGWFATVVFDPDNFDRSLDSAAEGADFRVAIVLACARGAIWCTRQILWTLMNVGAAISCFMMRQMEYDADSYECKVGGSDTFEQTMNRFSALSLADQVALEDVRQSWRKGHLPDDLPGLIVSKAATLPVRPQEQPPQSPLQPTAVFRTHPSDSERIQAAQKLAAPGVFRLTTPVAELFADFPALCKKVTRFWYEQQLRLPMAQVRLVGTAETQRDSDAEAEHQKALEAYLHGVNPIFYPLVLRPSLLPPATDATFCAVNLRKAKARLAEMEPAARHALERYAKADRQWIQMYCAERLLKSGFNASDGVTGSAAAQALQDDRKRLAVQMEQAGIDLKDFARVAGDRLQAALELLQQPAGILQLKDATPLADEAGRLAIVLSAIGQAFEVLHCIRRRLPCVPLLVKQRPQHSEPARVDRQLANVAGELMGFLKEARTAIQTVPYPFQSPRDLLSVADYAQATSQYANELEVIYADSQAHVDRLFALYYQILGRLVVIGGIVEARVEELPEVAEQC